MDSSSNIPVIPLQSGYLYTIITGWTWWIAYGLTYRQFEDQGSVLTPAKRAVAFNRLIMLPAHVPQFPFLLLQLSLLLTVQIPGCRAWLYQLQAKG